MANTLSVFDPIFYAQEALIAVEKNLGMASRVYRGYEKSPQDKGSTISIKVPATFSAQNAAGSNQNLTASSTSITLDQWKEVRFALSDKELSYTKEDIIEQHIRPAAYAIADNIDQALIGLYVDIYNYYGVAGTAPDAVDDITGVRKVLQDKKVPLQDRRLLLDTTAEEKMLQLAAFNTNAGTVESTKDVLLKGSLGIKFGFEVFSDQNAASHTTGTLTIGTALQLSTEATSGAASVVLKDSGGSLSGAVNEGDIITIAGDSQAYVITADATVAANVVTILVSPVFAATSAIGTVVTQIASHAVNMAFHKNAFTLSMAPLGTHAAQLGAKVATVNYNGLTIRSTIFHDGANSGVVVVLDVLYGVKTLDALLAARLLG